MPEQNDHHQKRAEKNWVSMLRHPLVFAIAAGTPFFLEPTIGSYWRDGKARWGIAIATSLLVGLLAYAIIDWKKRKSDS